MGHVEQTSSPHPSFPDYIFSLQINLMMIDLPTFYNLASYTVQFAVTDAWVVTSLVFFDSPRQSDLFLAH